MKRPTAVLIFCLQSWFVLVASSMPALELEEMEVSAESPSEFDGKLPEKRLYPPVTGDADFNGVAGDLAKRNDETEDDGSDSYILRNLRQVDRYPGKKRSFYEIIKKRSLRLLKRHEARGDKDYAEQQHDRRSLDGRDVAYRARRDAADAIELMMQIEARKEECKKKLQKEDVKRRKLEAGKRSADKAAGIAAASSETETANWRNYDVGSDLLAILGD
ncbi:hypothetical protein BsWGS_24233 [Bradybaena similaris]